MKRNTRTRQGGYALILMVLALMGIGGIVITGFTQGARQQSEQQRYLHNQRVLKEAKQALLQYAYNYPVINPERGPGRLPCPDMDNDGSANGSFNCKYGTPMVGRFPWNDQDMDFYDARDASGVRLWYAVSQNFANSISPTTADVINSDTQGTITIQDRSGGILHDGTGTSGAVAVIIATGSPIERNGVLQDRAADPNDAANYLDLFGAVDNADFVNNDLNGFVTGPIFNPIDGSLTVNDQMIVITAAEVTAMAEMATLQAYRTAINAYLDKAGKCTGTGTDRSSCESGGGTWNPVYPWLYNYDGIEYDIGAGESVDVAIKKLSTFFPALAASCSNSLWNTEVDCVVNGHTWGFHDEKATYLGIDTSGGNDGIFGRIPSIFANYFTETDSLKIDSNLVGSLEIDFSGLAVNSSGQGILRFNNGVMTLPFETTEVLTEVGFEDLATDGEGRFTATMPSPQFFSKVLYFWDDDDGPDGFYDVCPDDGDGVSELSDCWRYGVGPTGPSSPSPNNLGKEHILRVEIQLTLGGTLIVDADYDIYSPTTAIIPAGATSHAIIQGTYSVPDLLGTSNLPTAATITANYDWMDHYHSGNTYVWDPGDVAGTLTKADLLTASNLTLGMRYFPEAPQWALANGWHNSIRMAYALEYEPPGTGPCIVDATCLHLDDSPGKPQDKISLLVIARTHKWVDGDPSVPAAPNGKLRNDLKTVFDDGNHNDNPTFYRHRRNDKVLVIDEIGP